MKKLSIAHIGNANQLGTALRRLIKCSKRPQIVAFGVFCASRFVYTKYGNITEKENKDTLYGKSTTCATIGRFFV